MHESRMKTEQIQGDGRGNNTRVIREEPTPLNGRASLSRSCGARAEALSLPDFFSTDLDHFSTDLMLGLTTFNTLEYITQPDITTSPA